MSLCFVTRGIGIVAAMSFGDIGGNGPPHHSNQMPNQQRVQSVKRTLFGAVDHEQTHRDLEQELRKCQQQDMEKYNFDFAIEQPIDLPNPNYEWSRIGSDHTDHNDNIKQQQLSTKLCNKTIDEVIDQLISHSDIKSDSNCTNNSTASDLVSNAMITVSDGVQCIESNAESNQTTGITKLIRDQTSVTLTKDSQTLTDSSSTSTTNNDGRDVNKSNIQVKNTKQPKITAFLCGRKSGENERKRSAAAKSVSEEEREPKRLRRYSNSPSAVQEIADKSDEEEDNVQT
jgi:hypothetical protein